MIFSVSVLTITGTRSNLVACMEEIIPKINEVIRICCACSLNYTLLQSVHRGAPNFTTEVQLLVPEPYMGTIIGSGGQKIKTQRKVIVNLLCITLYSAHCIICRNQMLLSR